MNILYKRPELIEFNAYYWLKYLKKYLIKKINVTLKFEEKI